MKNILLVLSWLMAAPVIIHANSIPIGEEILLEDYTVIQKREFTLVGIECRTSNNPEAASKDIAALWDKFFTDNVSSKIPHKASEDVIALYCDYEGDHTKPYSLVIGHKVDSVEQVPEGMVVKRVPTSSYALFKSKGEYPKTLIETWSKVWKANLDRTYTGDYEVYGKKFESSHEVDLFIAIK